MSEDGMRMSNYGVKIPTPHEITGHWKESIRRQNVIQKSHLSTKGDPGGSKQWPGIKQPTKEELEKPGSFFGETKEKRETGSIYEYMFHIKQGYNSKLHRDDRQHTVGLDIAKEEEERPVPSRTSTSYGRYVETRPLEIPNRKHCRIDRVVKGFYKCRGTGIPQASD